MSYKPVLPMKISINRLVVLLCFDPGVAGLWRTVLASMMIINSY